MNPLCGPFLAAGLLQGLQDVVVVAYAGGADGCQATRVGCVWIGTVGQQRADCFNTIVLNCQDQSCFALRAHRVDVDVVVECALQA